LIISLPFGVTCITIIWILIFGIILVFRAKEIPIEYREHDYLRRLSILIPTIMIILVFILYQAFPIVQDYFEYDDVIEGITEETIEKYINENIKGVIYSDYAGMTFNPTKYREKFIFFIFNNGIENIDEDLQLSLIFPYDMNFSLLKPNNSNLLSYDSDETKPWVFGMDKITNIRWNKSLPGTTLSNKGVQWAIIHLETSSDFSIFLDYRHSIEYSAIINDIYFIPVKKYHSILLHQAKIHESGILPRF
jgi:hypothetical protein